MYYFWILTLSILSGQLLKLSIGTGGISVLDVTIIFLCLIGTWKCKFRLKRPPTFILTALLFVLIALISLTFTPLHLTKQEYLISFSYTVRLSFLFLLGWLIAGGTLSSLKKFISQVLLYSGVGLAILGLLQFIFIPDLRFLSQNGWDPHYFRTVSTFLDPNFAGAFFVLTLLLIFQNLVIAKKWNIHNLLFLVVYLALLTTFSRSSYLMLLTSGLILSFLKKSKSFAMLTFILFLGLMLGFYMYTKAISQPRHIDRAQSASFRLNTWQQGWKLFESHPILGVGFNAYRYALKQYNLADEQFILSHGGSSNDSSLLSVLATTGIIGLIGYFFFLFSAVKYAWGKNLTLIAALSGLLIHSFFANSLFFPPILLWIILKSSDTKT